MLSGILQIEIKKDRELAERSSCESRLSFFISIMAECQKAWPPDSSIFFFLKRSAECDDLDASLLLLKIVGFPVSDEVYRATTEAIQRDLCHSSFASNSRNQPYHSQLLILLLLSSRSP
jgi:hypothetical protein